MPCTRGQSPAHAWLSSWTLEDLGRQVSMLIGSVQLFLPSQMTLGTATWSALGCPRNSSLRPRRGSAVPASRPHSPGGDLPSPRSDGWLPGISGDATLGAGTQVTFVCSAGTSLALGTVEPCLLGQTGRHSGKNLSENVAARAAADGGSIRH